MYLISTMWARPCVWVDLYVDVPVVAFPVQHSTLHVRSEHVILPVFVYIVRHRLWVIITPRPNVYSSTGNSAVNICRMTWHPVSFSDDHTPCGRYAGDNLHQFSVEGIMHRFDHWPGLFPVQCIKWLSDNLRFQFRNKLV